MREKAEGHMGFPYRVFSPHFLKLLALPLLLIAASSCVYFLSSAFLTVLAIVLPTSLFFALSKRQQLQESDLVGKPQGMKIGCQGRIGNGTFEPRKHAHGGGGSYHPINGIADGSPKSSPVSEGEPDEILLDSVDQIPACSDSSTSEDESPEDTVDPIPPSSDGSASDDDESAEEDMDRAPASSESSISDEESLIEIALPDGQPVGAEEQKNTFSRPHPHGFLPGFSPELVLRQQELLELFPEMNEEDNLIEIDIAMGSVKCSRLGIKA